MSALGIWPPILLLNHFSFRIPELNSAMQCSNTFFFVVVLYIPVHFLLTFDSFFYDSLLEIGFSHLLVRARTAST